MTLTSAVGACVACLLFSGCVALGSHYSGGGGASSSSVKSPTSSGGDSSNTYNRESSRVAPNGDIVFRDSGEKTVVSPNGDVTVTQRDRDGTRTIVGSDGSVRVETPDGNCIGDC